MSVLSDEKITGLEDVPSFPIEKPQEGGKRAWWENDDLRDADIANEIAIRYGDVLRHNSSLGFLAYETEPYFDFGGVWKASAEKQAESFAEELIRDMIVEASKIRDAKKSQEVLSKVTKYLDEFKLDQVVKASKRKINIEIDSLDRYRDLINLHNGFVNLRDGNHMPHNSLNYFTQMANTRYDPQAKSPKWDEFLRLVSDGDDDLIHYLQVSSGYSATGHTSEHQFNFLYGRGRNGKSTLLTVLYKILGTYACSVPIETFLVNSIGNIREDIARLRGKRFVLTTESTYGRLNEELLKRITGGDPITARFLRKNSFEFFPQCTIWMMGNYLPIIRGSDEGIWSRVSCIPFDVRIPEDRIIKDYAEILLKEEADGIMAWVVQGAIEWYEKGLPKVERVVKKSKEYRSEMDILADFLCKYECDGEATLEEIRSIDEGLLQRSKYRNITSKELFDEYKEETGLHKTTAQTFRQIMEQRGFRYKRAGGVGCFFGISSKIGGTDY